MSVGAVGVAQSGCCSGGHLGDTWGTQRAGVVGSSQAAGSVPLLCACPAWELETVQGSSEHWAPSRARTRPSPAGTLLWGGTGISMALASHPGTAPATSVPQHCILAPVQPQQYCTLTSVMPHYCTVAPHPGSSAALAWVHPTWHLCSPDITPGHCIPVWIQAWHCTLAPVHPQYCTPALPWPWQCALASVQP